MDVQKSHLRCWIRWMLCDSFEHFFGTSFRFTLGCTGWILTQNNFVLHTILFKWSGILDHFCVTCLNWKPTHVDCFELLEFIFFLSLSKYQNLIQIQERVWWNWMCLSPLQYSYTAVAMQSLTSVKRFAWLQNQTKCHW